jgi:hypothetical protein
MNGKARRRPNGAGVGWPNGAAPAASQNAALIACAGVANSCFLGDFIIESMQKIKKYHEPVISAIDVKLRPRLRLQSVWQGK